MRRLTARVVPVTRVGPEARRAMYALFESYYDETTFERFSIDLTAKDDVIMLENEAREICGFSTMKNLVIDVKGKRHHGLFSGDTVVDRAYWGQRVLGRAFLKYLFGRKAMHPLSPFWWFLISKGYKTYLLMANNFEAYFPHPERETPELERAVLDAFGGSYFRGAYDRETGLIDLGESHGQVKAGVADITPELLRNPKIAFFQDRNPTWKSGTELACIARMTWTLPFAYAAKAVWKTRIERHRPVLNPASAPRTTRYGDAR